MKSAALHQCGRLRSAEGCDLNIKRDWQVVKAVHPTQGIPRDDCSLIAIAFHGVLTSTCHGRLTHRLPVEIKCNNSMPCSHNTYTLTSTQRHSHAKTSACRKWIVRVIATAACCRFVKALLPPQETTARTLLSVITSLASSA